MLRNGYVADENQCSSTETNEAFQEQKIREKQNLAYYFYGSSKWAFTDSSVFPFYFFFFNRSHQFADGLQIC